MFISQLYPKFHFCLLNLFTYLFTVVIWSFIPGIITATLHAFIKLTRFIKITITSDTLICLFVYLFTYIQDLHDICLVYRHRRILHRRSIECRQSLAVPTQSTTPSFPVYMPVHMAAFFLLKCFNSTRLY